MKTQSTANAPANGQIVFVADAGHVVRAFRRGEGGPWQTVDEDSNPSAIDFTPTHWGWRRGDLEAMQEKGGECELCGRPVRVGQVVLPYDDIGEVHADCTHPYRLTVERGEDSPEPFLLLGDPMRHFPLPQEQG